MRPSLSCGTGATPVASRSQRTALAPTSPEGANKCRGRVSRANTGAGRGWAYGLLLRRHSRALRGPRPGASPEADPVIRAIEHRVPAVPREPPRRRAAEEAARAPDHARAPRVPEEGVRD